MYRSAVLTSFLLRKQNFQSGRASIGDSIYRYMHTSDKFSPDHLLDCLNISSEHEALELADRVEASMYTWRRKACLNHSKSSWSKVKELMSENDRSDKNYILAERAETLLFCLKQRYPELSQTSLDTCKIQYNQVSFSIYKFICSIEKEKAGFDTVNFQPKSYFGPQKMVSLSI